MSELPSVLYVDDEELSHVLFKAVFGDYYEVHTALSAREAIEILQRESIHVLVTDQCMPEMTGAELLAAIDDEFPALGRVMLTAYSDIDAVIQAINTGRIDRYVTKPWEEASLKGVIDRALAIHDQRRLRQRRIEELEQRLAAERRLRLEFQKYVPQAVLDDLLDGGQD